MKSAAEPVPSVDVLPITSPEAYKSYVTFDCELEILTAPVEFEQNEEPFKTGTEGRGLTVIVISFEVAGEPAKQGVAFDVITQVTTALFTKVVEVYVVEFVPTFVPFTFH
jgi:hypothetical protein